MKIGNKVIEYSVYAKFDGVLFFVGDTTEITLPSIENLTDKISGAGILGEIDMPVTGQVGAMEFSMGFRNTTLSLAKLYAPGVQEVEVRWLVDQVDKGSGVVTKQAHKAFIRGMSKKMDEGKVQKNNSMDSSYSMEVLYYNRTLGGRSVLEIDKLNNVFAVDGVDYMKDVRDAL